MLFEAPSPLCVADLIADIDDPAFLFCGGDSRVRAIAPINESADGVLSFSNFSLSRTIEKFAPKPGAILIVKKEAKSVSPLTRESIPYSVVETANPRRWFISAVRYLFGNPERPNSGIHKFAVVEDGASIGDDVYIGPFVSIGKACQIKDRATIHHGSFIANQSIIEEDVTIRANSVIGVPGQALERDKNDQQILLPHLGRVVIGDKAIVGALSVIVAGSLENTEIGKGVMIGNQVNIGHNCKIGDHCFIAPQVVVAGSVRMGKRCWISPGAKIVNKMRIGDNAMIGLGAVVTKPVKEDTYVVGNPAVPVRKINRYNK